MDTENNHSDNRPWRARRGALAEDAAAAFVTSSGMKVLQRNVRVGHLELDIIARDRSVIAVVEVRTRGAGAWQRPLSSLGHVKCQRLRRAAAILWSRRWRKLRGIERVRFDVASVDLDTHPDEPQVEYVRAAF